MFNIYLTKPLVTFPLHFTAVFGSAANNDKLHDDIHVSNALSVQCLYNPKIK